MAEKAKRPKFIVSGFMFSAVLLVIFICITIFVIYPKITEISSEKENINKKITNLENLKKKGISFSEFNALKNSYKANLYLASLLKKADETFFNTNFVNNKDGEDFNSFFTKKVNEVNKSESSESFKEVQDSYKNVLPTYVEDNYKNEDGVMTDLRFITYIESILYTFNLEMANKNLNVGNLNILSDYSGDKESPLDTTIFYIPYTFNVTGKKSDILDFIYFLENVGSIKVNDNGEIEVYKDNFIKKSLIGFDDGNILKNEIIDIEKIKMSEYIDSGVESNDKENLADFIKRTQGNEKISISLDVRFYVKGVPNYKIMEGINNLSIRYTSLKEEYEKAKNNKNLPIEDKAKVEKGVAYLKELGTTINDIKKEKIDLNVTYKKVLEVNKLLDVLQSTIKQ